MTIEPEHGPAPYLHTLPHTNVPVADLWAVNDWIKNTEVRSLTAEGRGVGVVRLRDRGVSAEWETVFVLVLSSQILSPLVCMQVTRFATEVDGLEFDDKTLEIALAASA